MGRNVIEFGMGWSNLQNWNEPFLGKSPRMTRVHVTPSKLQLHVRRPTNFDSKELTVDYRVQYQATICYRRWIGINWAKDKLPCWTGPKILKGYFVGPLRDLPGPSTSFSWGTNSPLILPVFDLFQVYLLSTKSSLTSRSISDHDVLIVDYAQSFSINLLITT